MIQHSILSFKIVIGLSMDKEVGFPSLFVYASAVKLCGSYKFQNGFELKE